MSIYFLTGMFPNGFPADVAKQLKKVIKKSDRFAFVVVTKLSGAV